MIGIRLLGVLLLGIICTLATSESTNIKCIPSERRALLNFKKGLIDRANLLATWTSEDENEECCKWTGVRCSRQTGHIVMLDLRPQAVKEGKYEFTNMPMYGQLGMSLLDLPYLSHLDLSVHNFTITSEVFGSLMNLTELEYLDLSDNRMPGSISPQLGNLSQLSVLRLGSFWELEMNSLKWLHNLSRLRTLTMRYVNLTEATDWIHSIKLLPSLETLQLIDCQLPHQIIPLSFSHVNTSNSLRFVTIFDIKKINIKMLPLLFNISSKLVNLTLSAQMINGQLPESNVYNGSSLVNLDLSGSQLVGGIPKSFGNLCSLRVLDLSRNNLSGLLSDLLQNLSSGCTKNSLEILRLDSNKLRGGFPDITKFTSLREFYLNDNKLDGIISKSSHNLSNLLVLNLDGNELQGSSSGFSSFTSLKELRASKNKLKGVLRFDDFSASLRVLDVSLNYFNGVISEVDLTRFTMNELDLSYNSLRLRIRPDWVSSFQLVTLKLRNCELGPKFPSWLQTQKNLTYLDISNSNISDVIPTWFWNFSSKLQHQNVSFNRISGEVPDLPIKFDTIPAIDLSYNKFHGLLPMFLFNASVLNLSNNKFRGSLHSLCIKMDMPLSYLDLSHNLLHGELPDCWMHFQSLAILNLENNNLFGKIPMSIGSLSWLESLILRNNSLSGYLPLSLMNCSSLKLVDLGENKLSGEVPVGDSWKYVIILRLRSNNFNGSISTNICKLISLQVLDLSFNNISGSIPSCLNNFTAMVQTKTMNSMISSHYINAYEFWSGNGEWEGHDETYTDSVLVWWKGIQQEYKNTLGLVKLIDLSSNQLEGIIPEEVTSLLGLISLNLSRNKLVETIPKKIGELKMLDSLDLSRNQLSGEIPQSLADSTFLSYLDLSNNKLSGRIPSSTQLQSFNASSYMENLGLCGLPLPICPGDETVPSRSFNNDNNQEGGEWFDITWLFAGSGFGFFTGLCVILGTILFSKKWRHAYFRVLYDIQEWILLMIALRTARLKRRFIN